MTVSEFPLPPKDLTDTTKFLRSISSILSNLMLGRGNNVLDVTVDANQAATTVTDSRIGVHTVAICVPTTANASAIALPYRDTSAPVNGSMSLIHANDANADKTFKVVLVG